ncbi:MAG: L,D-transpeptidase family protein [Planctomycetota bacterium]
MLAVQTLKTAAIVVLMMTVLYGAYVSMTTPPDPLPPEIMPMLVESGEFEISNGLPESFDDFGVDEGVAMAEPAEKGPATELISPDGVAVNADRGPVPPESLDAANRTFADLPSPDLLPSSTDGPSDLNAADLASSVPDQSASFSMSDQAAARRLPPVGGTSGSVNVDPARDYPTTSDSFALPDPNEIDASSLGMKAEDPMIPSGAIAANSDSDIAAAGLNNAIATADRQYVADRRREALATLSLFYETPNLTSSQRDQLLVRLDPLAREVIYSREHLLDKPHRVGPNETLMEIANRYDVPWQLLANINGIQDPVTVLPGRDLKIVRGPFRADVDLANLELTLFVGDLYAGRFPIAVGSDPAPQPGTYTIQEKQASKTYYDMSGTPIPPGSPRNPYGSMWIDLGSGVSLHGSPEADRATTNGCISVAGNYSRDVFGILSEGSSVTIR